VIDIESALDSHKQHHYTVQVKWTGNRGEGTSGYRTYSRNHELSAPGKPALPGSSDPTFRGDPERYNPEELLVGSLSTCHMLWYLHLCAEAKIIVLQYVDEASGVMAETSDGGGRFTDVLLRPQVVLAADGDLDRAVELHERAHHLCFIANSVNFPVRCEPQTRIAEPH
jgi:organic hydroperoxide reductase OsmC/OhrA